MSSFQSSEFFTLKLYDKVACLQIWVLYKYATIGFPTKIQILISLRYFSIQLSSIFYAM